MEKKTFFDKLVIPVRYPTTQGELKLRHVSEILLLLQQDNQGKHYLHHAISFYHHHLRSML